MSAISRRRLGQLGSAAARPLAATHTRAAEAAEFTSEFANNLGDSHPLIICVREAADRILKGAGGPLI